MRAPHRFAAIALSLAVVAAAAQAERAQAEPRGAASEAAASESPAPSAAERVLRETQTDRGAADRLSDALTRVRPIASCAAGLQRIEVEDADRYRCVGMVTFVCFPGSQPDGAMHYREGAAFYQCAGQPSESAAGGSPFCPASWDSRFLSASRYECVFPGAGAGALCPVAGYAPQFPVTIDGGSGPSTQGQLRYDCRRS